MLVVLSAGMEGVSQVRGAREIVVRVTRVLGDREARQPRERETGEHRRRSASRRRAGRLVAVPGAATLAARIPHGAAVETTMRQGGFTRTGELGYEIELDSWQDARDPVGAATLAAFAPVLDVWSKT